MNSSSQDCRKAIAELNEELSNLEKQHKIKAVDPKIEKAVQYYKGEKEKAIASCDKTIKAIDAKIENYTKKADREKKELDDKLTAYTEKIERQKKDIDNALELTIEKIEGQIKDEKTAIDIKVQYYDVQIQQRGGVIDDPVHEMKKAEIIKNREWQLKMLKEHEADEAYLQRIEMDFRTKIASRDIHDQRGKKKYFYNGKTYASQDLVNAVIAREIAEYQNHSDDEEHKKELEERRKEDELYEKRMKELEMLEKENKIIKVSEISENDL